jgi:dihydroflavonol-4-reductase
MGTINVLKSAGRATPRPRVVLTSSVAAVHGEYAAPPANGGDLYTCDDWNESSTVEGGQAYHVSKTRAEREAWRVAGELGLDLRAVCPNFVLGPVISPSACGTSVGYVKAMVEGGRIEGAPIVCDVRDVALAHIRAATLEAASGRYIVSHAAPVLPATVAAALAAGLPPGARLGEVVPPSEAGAGRPRIDASRTADELGVVPRPVEETIADMARSLVAVGLAKVG